MEEAHGHHGALNTAGEIDKDKGSADKDKGNYTEVKGNDTDTLDKGSDTEDKGNDKDKDKGNDKDKDKDKGNDTEEDKSFARLEGALRKEFKSQGLSPFSSRVAIDFLRSKLALPGGHARFTRVVQYLLSLLNAAGRVRVQQVLSSSGVDVSQSGCPNIIPGLRAQPFWDTSAFPWVQELEASFPDIRDEFLALRDCYNPSSTVSTSGEIEETSASPFQHYRSPATSDSSSKDHLGALSTDKGDWNVCYLHLHGMDFEGNLQKCPKTAAVIQ